MSNAQSEPFSQDFLNGRLLIAMPNMGDPRFEQAVILICAHTAESAMGLVINKPLTSIDFCGLLDQLNIDLTALERADDPVIFGGPVNAERGFVLHTLDYRADETVPVAADIGYTATRDILVDIANADGPAPRKSIMVLGYAGWGPGQLESEIAANAWLHADADEGLVFNRDLDKIWMESLGRLGVTEAMFSSEWSTARDSKDLIN